VHSTGGKAIYNTNDPTKLLETVARRFYRIRTLEGFAERTHAHTALYSLVARHQRDTDRVPLEKIPPMVRHAFIAAEDSGFYEHLSPLGGRGPAGAEQRARRLVVEPLCVVHQDEDGLRALARRAGVQRAFDKLEKDIIRKRIAVDKKRPDGRAPDELRDIWIEVGVARRLDVVILDARLELRPMRSSSAPATSPPCPAMGWPRRPKAPR